MSDRLLAETGRCVACGLCLPHCPTYRKTQSEADSPRGRILMTQAVMQGALPMNEKYIAHIDLCLTCRACERACPNQVPYGEIVDEVRARIRALRPLPRMQRIAGYLAAHRAWWQPVALALRFVRHAGLHKWIGTIPAASRPCRFSNRYEAANAIGEIGLFLGCATSVLDAETLAASIYLLNRLGYTVHVPATQTCCGGLHRQMGDKEQADALERRNLAAFGDMPVVTVASGCGARLAESMSERVQDISAFLVRQDWGGIDIAPLDATIAVHDPCSLRNGLKAEQHPYALLRHIPTARIIALPGNDQCCGGAGSYLLTQPEMADRLRQDKMNACKKIQPEYLATSNIGCALHLSRGLGSKASVVHPVWLLARQAGFEGKLP